MISFEMNEMWITGEMGIILVYRLRVSYKNTFLNSKERGYKRWSYGQPKTIPVKICKAILKKLHSTREIYDRTLFFKHTRLNIIWLISVFRLFMIANSTIFLARSDIWERRREYNDNLSVQNCEYMHTSLIRRMVLSSKMRHKLWIQFRGRPRKSINIATQFIWKYVFGRNARLDGVSIHKIASILLVWNVIAPGNAGIRNITAKNIIVSILEKIERKRS